MVEGIIVRAIAAFIMFKTEGRNGMFPPGPVQIKSQDFLVGMIVIEPLCEGEGCD